MIKVSQLTTVNSMDDTLVTLANYFACRISTPMEPQQFRSGVVIKVDSKHSWDFYINQSSIQNCPIVAHFTADWCMPSVAMNPLMEELASTYETVVFLSVDMDELKEVANRYEVKAMPTFLLLKDSTPVDKVVGANPEEIKKRVHSLIGPSTRVGVA